MPQTIPSSDGQQLDSSVVNLAKAIRQSESQGNYTAKGASGEYGAYQWMPGNFESAATKYKLNPSDKSAINQDKVAYYTLKEMKDQGLSPAQIASKWNSGSPNFEGKVGVNSKGVKYDVPKYVSTVISNFRTIKAGATPPTLTSQPAPVPQDMSGATFPSSPTDTPLTSGLKTVGNVPSSLFNFVKSTIQTMNPVEITKNFSQYVEGFPQLVKELGGDSNKAALSVISEMPKATYEALVPQLVRSLLAGDTEAAQKAVVNDPVGQIGPLVGGLRAAAKAAGAGALADTALAKTAKAVTKPVGAVTGAVTDKIGATAKYAASQATGLSPETLKTTVELPKELSAAQKSGLDRSTLGSDLHQKIKQRLTALSDLGSEYDPIRKSTKPVMLPLNWFEDVLAKHNIPVEKGKITTTKESTVLNGADVSALQHFYDKYGKDPNHSPNSFLNTREALTQLSRFDATKTGNLEAVAKDARSTLNNSRNQIDGLIDKDAKYAPEAHDLRLIAKEWLDPKTKELKDSALSRIANATSDTNAPRLKRLEAIQPGITKQIRVLKAIEDIHNAVGLKVGTYVRGGAIVTGIATGNLPMIVGAILTQPELAVPLIKGFGYTRKTVGPVIRALRSAAGDINRFRLPSKGGDSSTGTGSSKPSTATDTSTSKKPTGKEDVYAPPADTSGSFDGTIHTNEPNTNLGDSSGRGLLGRIVDHTKAAIDNAKNNGQRGFIKNPLAGQYPGEKKLTSSILDSLEGKTVVSKQFLENLTNQPSMRQAERDAIRALLKNEGDKVNAIDFANKVKTELLPLKRMSISTAADSMNGQGGLRYEGITLPHELRGPVANYDENIYRSPIKTSAADVHFGDVNTGDYFAHTRIEDLPVGEVKVTGKDLSGNPIYDMPSQANGKGGTRRVIEVQSDLFQKGRLENERGAAAVRDRPNSSNEELSKIMDAGASTGKNLDGIAKLEPYRNTWQERVISEEVKQAAKDGKTKLQFPTGETAMKIEGLGNQDNWFNSDPTGPLGGVRYEKLTPDTMRVGMEVHHAGSDGWLITDVLGNGKFKAIPRDSIGDMEEELSQFGSSPEDAIAELASGNEEARRILSSTYDNETFDISGKVDTSNPIYRFYDKTVQKYLTNKFNAKVITDPQGVSWVEVPITKDMATRPVHAFTGLGSNPTR